MLTQRVNEAISYERARAHNKHKDGLNGSMETKYWDSPSWLPVVVEEVGEVARVLCERQLGTFVNDQDCLGHLREELVQVAAMVTAWIDAVDREYLGAPSDRS